ncbi:hypothetical protein AMAG_09893 [Allomyces macrogynus ATCC 38327]|uniref:J domain-containing protein n=1 Tax=Allomyces macrogynus (strain ATCC 38327) TaxID=578462 RepID=A0A0L0SPS8_ALLM3|nr:hypothetical protein AMAG_09893 [Allomyces macrogynus ATCC 38327]|eukprot:KNE64533.1 hypothetical protein AMAG_09893 [Allomyces macrogynus ATCC 38327]
MASFDPPFGHGAGHDQSDLPPGGNSSGTDSSGNDVTLFLLWFFVPNWLTGFLVTKWLAWRYPDPALRPTPGTPAYARTHYVVYALVIGAYIAYSVADALATLPPNAYHALDLPPQALHAATSSGDAFRLVRDHYRRQVLTTHPDKSGGADETEFLWLSAARDLVTDAGVRRVYERLGPDAAAACLKASGPVGKTASWVASACAPDQYASLAWDHVTQSMAGYYVVWAAIMGVMYLFRAFSTSTYWRFTFLALLAATELAVTVDRVPAWLAVVLARFSWRTPHEAVVVLHKLFPLLTLALNQLGPIVHALTGLDAAPEPDIGVELNRVHQVADALVHEVHRIKGVPLPTMDPNAGGGGEAMVEPSGPTRAQRGEREIGGAVGHDGYQ